MSNGEERSINIRIGIHIYTWRARTCTYIDHTWRYTHTPIRGMHVSKKVIYLPRCSFSFKTKDPAIATRTNMRGLNTETKSGPLMCTHHAISVTISPEATIPYLVLNGKRKRK